MRESVVFTDDCTVVKIPEGEDVQIEEGTDGFLVQTRGGNATVRIPSELWQVQLEPDQLDLLEKPDGDSLDIDMGDDAEAPEEVPDDIESAVYDQLRKCYDPEIPVNIVELGLIYGIDEIGDQQYTVDVDMTLTAQGCGMGDHLAGDAEKKVRAIPGVSEASVDIVWDPKWNESMMSDEARQKLGFG
ncbi:MAG: iron-sulfur cluster assembly protein [bacterium]